MRTGCGGSHECPLPGIIGKSAQGSGLGCWDSHDRHAVKAVRECLPHLDVVAALALIVEAVHAVDGRALVIAAQEKEVLGVLDFEGENETDHLQAVFASVYVIAQEQVVRIRREATVFEHAQEIVELSVDVAAHFDRSLDLQQHGLAQKNLTGPENEGSNLVLSEINLLPHHIAGVCIRRVNAGAGSDRLKSELLLRHLLERSRSPHLKEALDN